jgi:D-glycero-alpha-D-manno-heptose 1-phosphate guanylyltransferase
MAMTAIILAGGQGTRLRPALPDLPKALAPVAGRPFLSHLLDHWIAQGVGEVILSVGYRHAQIRDAFGSAYRGVPLHYAVEETPLGTGGGLLLAAAQLTRPDPVLVLNGDIHFPVALAPLQTLHAQKQSAWSLALFHADQPSRFGRIRCERDGRVLAFDRENAAIGEPANAGIYWIDPAVLQDAPWRAGDAVSLEAHLLPALIAQQTRCYGTAYGGKLIDIGLPDDYRRAQQLLSPP